MIPQLIMPVNTKNQLNWLYGLKPSRVKLGLDRTAKLLAAVGNPHLKFKSIHITGSTGKGSVAAMLESILRQADLKTGLYTSPHLFNFNERVRVNNQEISDQTLAVLVDEIKAAMTDHQIDATFHEFTTVLAFLHFARQQVDIAVIEVCMGGRLDTTNVITPLVSIITNISLDHTNYLGNTRQQIAREKGGIIKPGVPLVTNELDPAIRAIFSKICHQNKSDLHYAPDLVNIKPLKSNLSQQTFCLNDLLLNLSLLGPHQLDNSATALAAIQLLKKSDLKISAGAIQAGLAQVSWPGRLQVVSTKPLIIVDAGHNAKSTQVLRDFIIANMPSRDILVLAKKIDKDIKPALDLLVPLFKRVIVTEGVFQPLPASDLARAVAKQHNNVEIIKNPQAATRHALKSIKKNHGLLITGSLYMIPESLRVLNVIY